MKDETRGRERERERESWSGKWVHGGRPARVARSNGPLGRDGERGKEGGFPI